MLYRLVPGKWRWMVLLGASLYFYMQWNVALGALMLLVVGVCWAAGLAVDKAQHRRTKKAALGLSLAVCLGLLGYFKYFGFLMEGVNAVAGWLGGGPFRTWDVILPVGVSFYTFQAMSYVVDVYRGDLEAERHPGYFALYVTFFPQLVAGPIERATRLLPQLRAHRDPTPDDLHMGVRLLLSGFFRKVVIADFAAQYVDRIYGAGEADGLAVLVATLLFALQIYCDFAGYSEIAAGSARIMGVRLMRNFDRPYMSAAIREFWRRWHISLSTWLTDYVYIPLGGSRRGVKRQILATLAVFALSGAWHGAAWTFIVWGLLHGAMMTADILMRGRIRWPRWCGVALTFAFVCLTWVFFRAASLGHAAALLSSLFTAWDVPLALNQLGMPVLDGLQVLLMVALLPMLHRLTDEQHPVRDMTLALLAVAVALAWAMRLEGDISSAFIYFQF